MAAVESINNSVLVVIRIRFSVWYSVCFTSSYKILSLVSIRRFNYLGYRYQSRKDLGDRRFSLQDGLLYLILNAVLTPRLIPTPWQDVMQ